MMRHVRKPCINSSAPYKDLLGLIRLKEGLKLVFLAHHMQI